MASTLKEFYINKRDKIKTLETDTKDRLDKATKGLREAQLNYDKLVVEYADIEKAIKKTRKALNTALMPADIERHAQELREYTLQFRRKRGELIAAENKISPIQCDKKLAEAQLTRIGSALTAADAQVKDAELREDQHSDWRQIVAQGDLTELALQALALLEAVSEDEEERRSEGSRAPGGDDTTHDDVVSSTDVRQDGNAGLAAIEEGIREGAEARAVERSEHAIGGDASDGNDPENLSLIQQAKARIDKDIPAALKKLARERGQGIDENLNAKIESLKEAEDELDNHRATSEGATGESAKCWREYARAEGAFQDYVLQSAQRFDQALSLLQTVSSSEALTEAGLDRINDPALVAGDETPSRLDLWEAAIPDHIWANLVSYDNAIMLLTRVTEGNPTALDDDMGSAEQTLITALQKEDQGQEVKESISDQITRLTVELESLRNTHHQRKLSAVRGDA